MENIPESDSGQGGHPDSMPVGSIGTILRQERERRGLTVADVADQIKFAARQIEALEADDFVHLPEVAFIRGFVRSYAKILQLDPETLLSALPLNKEAHPGLVPPSVGVPFPKAPHSNRQQNMVWTGAAALLGVIVIGLALWHFNAPPTPSKQPSSESRIETPVQLPIQENAVPGAAAENPETVQPASPGGSREVSSSGEQVSGEAPPQQSRSVKPEVAKSAGSVRKAKPQSLATNPASGVSDTTAEPAELHLVFGEESWTEIKDRDGRVISSQLNPAGSELRLKGNPPFSLLVGHGASANLYFRGRQVDLKPYINRYSEVAHVTLK